VDSPAVIIDAEHLTASMRRIMRGMKKDAQLPSAKQNLEINPRHNIITRLDKMRSSDSALAQKVAEQVLDNARVAAGLLEDPRTMLGRLNELLEQVLAGKQ
jgi:TNF receptor-associated protein 1